MTPVKTSATSLPTGAPLLTPVEIVAVPHWLPRAVVAIGTIIILSLLVTSWQVIEVKWAIEHLNDVINLKCNVTPK